MTKYKEKFEKMRIAGDLASKTLDLLTDYIKPGISTDKIDQLAFEFIKDNGGYSAPQFYRGFKKSLCTSLNHVVCHGIPTNRFLEDGDIINVDVTAVVDNFYGDTSRMFTIGNSSIKFFALTEGCPIVYILLVSPKNSLIIAVTSTFITSPSSKIRSEGMP